MYWEAHHFNSPIRMLWNSNFLLPQRISPTWLTPSTPVRICNLFFFFLMYQNNCLSSFLINIYNVKGCLHCALSFILLTRERNPCGRRNPWTITWCSTASSASHILLLKLYWCQGGFCLFGWLVGWLVCFIHSSTYAQCKWLPEENKTKWKDYMNCVFDNCMKQTGSLL